MHRYLGALMSLFVAFPAYSAGFGAPVVQAEPLAAASGWYVFGALAAPRSGPSYTYEPGFFEEEMPSNVTAVPLKGRAASLGFGRETMRRGAISFGFEVDLTAGDIESDLINGETTPCLIGEEGCTAALNWLATGRLVVGWKQNSTMPFVTFGVAAGDVSGTADLGACGYEGTCGYSGVQTGWTAGIGLRHELSARWALKAELLHVDLGNIPFSAQSVTGQQSFGLGRLGVIHKF
jgi:opacity protein-like surface antigen